MTGKQDLAALIGSRICHDLISPIGAIGNGVELLAMSGDASGPEMALINDSVTNANARIRFFRIAFGAASDSQRISRSEVTSILSAVAAGGRCTYSWLPMNDAPRDQVRMAFLAMMCLETALPLGGDITVTETGQLWEVSGIGRRVKVEDDLWANLAGARSDVTAAQVQFALLPDAAIAAGRHLTVEGNETGPVTIRF